MGVWQESIQNATTGSLRVKLVDFKDVQGETYTDFVASANDQQH